MTQTSKQRRGIIITPSDPVFLINWFVWLDFRKYILNTWQVQCLDWSPTYEQQVLFQHMPCIYWKCFASYSWHNIGWILYFFITSSVTIVIDIVGLCVCYAQQLTWLLFLLHSMMCAFVALLFISPNIFTSLRLRAWIPLYVTVAWTNAANEKWWVLVCSCAHPCVLSATACLRHQHCFKLLSYYYVHVAAVNLIVLPCLVLVERVLYYCKAPLGSSMKGRYINVYYYYYYYFFALHVVVTAETILCTSQQTQNVLWHSPWYS